MLRLPEQTNLDAIRRQSIILLHSDIKRSTLPPQLHVYHPYITTSIVVPRGDITKAGDLLEDYEIYKQVMAQFEKMIMEADLVKLKMLVNSPYRLTWFKYVYHYMDLATFSSYLADIWVNSEDPNNDVNVTRRQVLTWFRNADPKHTMDEEDYEIWHNLPEEFDIYRGVSIGRNPKGLSYTRNLDKAIWFAHRFDKDDQKGYVLKGKGLKKYAYAYMNSRGEDEILYDPSKLEKERLEV